MKFLSRLFDPTDLYKTIIRFPLCFAFSIFTFFMAFTEINDLIKWNDDWAARLLLFLITGFFWSCCIKIVQESLDWQKVKYYSVLGAGLSVYAILLILGSKDNPNMLNMLSHMVAANFILLCVAPFICRSSNNESLWEYNRRFWFGVALAFIASIVFWAGFSGVLASIGYLFDVKIEGEIYVTLWCFAAIVFAPLYALSNVPTVFDYEYRDCDLRTSLTFLVKWILLPLVFAYFLILYAYFIKILILWEIPKGEMSWIILGFSGAGLVTYLMAWPYQMQEQRFFKIFYKAFFPLLILPALMLCLAVYLRIEQYGFTAQRFYVSLMGAYLIMLSISMSICTHKLRTIFLIPVFLMLLTSTPLLNAKGISEKSQRAILENTLSEYGLFKEGIIVSVDNADVSYEDRKKISGAYDYLSSSYRYNQRDEKLYGYKERDKFFEAVGFEYVSKWDVQQFEKNRKENKFRYHLSNSRKARAIKISGYDYYFVYASVHSRNNKSDELSTSLTNQVDNLNVKVGLRDNVLKFDINEERIVIDVTHKIQKITNRNSNMEPMAKEFILTGRSENYNLEYRVNNFSGEYEKGKPILKSMNGQLFIKVK